MIPEGSLAINAAGYLVALAITAVSGYYTYRQRLTAYQLVRDFLILVYGVIVVLMAVDLARVATGSPALMSVYPLLSFGVGFVEAILLLTAAVGGYLRPNGSSYRLVFKDLRTHTFHLLMFALFIVGTLAAEVYLAALRPFSTVNAHDFAGGTVKAVAYDTTFAATIGALFFFFLAYPVTLLVLGAVRVQNPQMRRAQLGLAAGFAGSTAIYLVSSVSLFDYGLDVTAVAYVVLSVFFGLVARNFRKAAVFAGFVLPVATEAERTPAKEERTTTREGRQVALEDGQLALVEVDTSVAYEESVLEVVRDFFAEKRGVFVVSPKGSRLHTLLSTVPGVRLYTMSESARYIAPSTTRTDEVNIPLFDAGVLLEVLERTLGSSTEPVALVFDSVSDMVIYTGFQTCYKFLKEAGAIASGKKAVVLFVMFRGAEDARSAAAIRSVFPSQLRIGPDGIEIVR